MLLSSNEQLKCFYYCIKFRNCHPDSLLSLLLATIMAIGDLASVASRY